MDARAALSNPDQLEGKKPALEEFETTTAMNLTLVMMVAYCPLMKRRVSTQVYCSLLERICLHRPNVQVSLLLCS